MNYIGRYQLKTLDYSHHNNLDVSDFIWKMILCQEITNRLGKDMIRNMGANKTIKSISRAMNPVSGIKVVVMENYVEDTHLEKRSHQAKCKGREGNG